MDKKEKNYEIVFMICYNAKNNNIMRRSLTEENIIKVIREKSSTYDSLEGS